MTAGPNENSAGELEVRALLVDAREKEFTVGPPHEITNHLFVVQQVLRLNDDLPGDKGPVRWIWQRAGWLLVNGTTGRISAIHLPGFDPDTSVGSWYRDYFAYCGVSENGIKRYAMVAEVGQRKPLLKEIERGESSAEPDPPPCLPPEWQRQPTRVTFHMAAPGGSNIQAADVTYRIGGEGAEVIPGQDDNDSASKPQRKQPPGSRRIARQ